MLIVPAPKEFVASAPGPIRRATASRSTVTHGKDTWLVRESVEGRTYQGQTSQNCVPKGNGAMKLQYLPLTFARAAVS